MQQSRHIVIAGPGRSGTTLLVKLLDRLGFDIGDPELGYFESAHAGLETRLLSPEAPRVIKSPDLTWQLGEMLSEGEVTADQIEWLVIPLRNLDEVAASRIRLSVINRDVRAPGGLVRTTRPMKQRTELASGTYGLFQAAALHEIPVIVLEYPRFARDADYALRRLGPMLSGVTADAFYGAWEDVVDPDLVHENPVVAPRLADARIAMLRLRRWVKGRFVS